MRQTLLALAVAALGGFAMANCGSSSNNSNGDMGKDMAGAGGPVDMAAAKINCLGVGYCIATCTTDLNTCIAMCQKLAKTGSYNKFAAAVNCGQNYCAPDPDAGTTGDCVRVAGAQGTYLCAPGQAYSDCVAGTTMTACTTCLDNAVGTPLIGDGTTPPTGMCTTPTAPSCKGGTMCATLMNACISDP